MDNTTPIACIDRMASTKKALMTLTKQVWFWAIERNITISAEFLAGKLNTIANLESRVNDNVATEWMLVKSVHSDVCKILGHICLRLG